MQVKILVEKFLSYCEKHRSPATVRHYRSRLKSFQKRFADREFADLSPLEIEESLDEVNYFSAGRPAESSRYAAGKYRHVRDTAELGIETKDHSGARDRSTGKAGVPVSGSDSNRRTNRQNSLGGQSAVSFDLFGVTGLGSASGRVV